jgi:hypothetical protein
MAASEWDWAALAQSERDQRWRRLSAWVIWLQEHYSAWVKLPPCWPLHEALRSELEFLRAWHDGLIENGDGAEGLSWHSSMRSSAAAWAELSDCKHSDQPWRRSSRGDNEEYRRHLAAAMREKPASRP